MKMGICTDGIEEDFEKALIGLAKPIERFIYLEVGTAGCDTFRTVREILWRTDSLWYMIAIDPSESAHQAYVDKIKYKEGTIFLQGTREDAFLNARDKIGHRLDFVFLDGCHSKACVVGDFTAVEPLVVPGGLVVFHDLEDEPGDFQPHCKAPRGVREGLEELRLWQDARPGWKRLPDWQCDKTKNAFSCGVFSKL